MILEYILFFVGIFFLVKGADFLVEGSSEIAKKIKISPFVIGLTIVAFGTSVPELIVNVFAAFNGSTGVAFGNIIGSNIANILLVLGVVAIMKPIKVDSSTVWKQIPFALLAAIVLFISSNYLFLDNINLTSLTRVSGLIFLCFFAIFIYYVISISKRKGAELDVKDFDIKGRKNSFAAASLIVVGLIGLYFGGNWVVDGAVFMAKQLGLSDFLISATIIAIGTSLPELVTGVKSVLRNKEDIGVGGAIGSNIFNIFWILGITALISPVVVPSFINSDILFLIGSTLLLFSFMFIGKKHELSRWQGVLFLLLYVLYIVAIIIRG